ncbi:nuclear transport factor 2 family protein [Polaribacter sp. Hel_I_88]|uniref:nuclear transport factor 2 family protein n=1 Tax=Polaribacter sp. Hel_I_88 TaxID=1250006 RepID=UPI00047E97F2|nr:nuclear transport factor 2 family protein [Polaribacter sp. Hel_I_88]
MIKYTTILLLCFSLHNFSQEKTTPINEIQQTIQNYYDGYIERDIDKLNKAFDTENGTMKIPITENDKTVGFKNAYFKDLMPIWGNRAKLSEEILINCALQILHIDVVDAEIASAKISMRVDRVTYVDILSLQKIKNVWKITNKIFVVRK